MREHRGCPTLPLQAVVMPSVHDGQRGPGLRFGDPRVVALLGAVCAFDTVFDGLTNAALRVRMAALYDAAYSSAQATYDLRRLRLKGIIERVPGRHRYQVTPYGRWIATFFTRLATRVVVPTLADLDSISRPPRRVLHPVASAWRAFDKELRTLLRALRPRCMTFGGVRPALIPTRRVTFVVARWRAFGGYVHAFRRHRPTQRALDHD